MKNAANFEAISCLEVDDNIVLTESVDTRLLFYKLSESEIFKMANEKTIVNGGKLIDTLPLLMKDGAGFAHIDLESFDKELIYEIFDSSQYNIKCKKSIKSMISSGKIVLAYSDTIKLPTSIPYIIKPAKRDSVIYVNISDFVTMDKYGNIQITNRRNMNGFMAILFAAAMTYRLVETTASALPATADGLFLMYGNMLSKVVCTIAHADSATKDKIRYLCTEFALVQAYGTDKGVEIFQRIKMKNFPLSNLVMDAIDNNFKLDNFDNVELFLTGLNELYPITKNVNLGNMFEKWVKTYGAATALSIDYIGYQIYIFSMLMFESSFVSRLAVESTINPVVATSLYKYMQEHIDD